MQVQTELTYEALAKALGFDPAIHIDLVEVDRIKGSVVLLVSGKLPPGTVTRMGFHPSPKFPGSEPDTVHPSYLTQKG